MKNQRITIIVGQDYRTTIEEKAKSAQISISAYVRRCLEYYNNNSEENPTESYKILQDQVTTKDEQIDKLQQALNQSQQLQLIHSAELAKIRKRPLLDRLRAIFVADWLGGKRVINSILTHIEGTGKTEPVEI